MVGIGKVQLNFSNTNQKGKQMTEAEYDAMIIEIEQLSSPINFRDFEDCELIALIRQGQPVWAGDPCLNEVPF